MLLLRKEFSHADGELPNDPAMNLLHRLSATIATRIAIRPIKYVAFGVALVIGLGVTFFELQPRYRLADQVPDREQAIAASNRLDEKLTGAKPLHIHGEMEKSR